MTASVLKSAGTLLSIVTPLVAIPLTVITFYLRSLREHQVSWHAALVRRVESVETSVADLRKAVGEFERDYTTKEEWLRECMLARRTLEQLSKATVRIETTVRDRLPGPDTGPGFGRRCSSNDSAGTARAEPLRAGCDDEDDE